MDGAAIRVRVDQAGDKRNVKDAVAPDIDVHVDVDQGGDIMNIIMAAINPTTMMMMGMKIDKARVVIRMDIAV